MKKNNFNILWGLLPELLLLAGSAQGQSLVKYSIGAGSGSLTSGTNTIIVSTPFFSTTSGTNTSGSIFPGFLTGLCQKPPKPTISLSGANTVTPVLTSSANSDNQWYLNGNPISGATGKTYTVAAEGIYTVQVGGACPSEFANDFSLIITGDLSSPLSSIVVYPNPVEDYLQIAGLKSDEPRAAMIDMAGRSEIISLLKSNEVHRARVDQFLPGIYLLRIIEKDNVYQVKVLKR